MKEHELLLIISHSHAVPQIEEDLEDKPGGDLIPEFRRRIVSAIQDSVTEALAKAVPAILSWGKGGCALARTRDYYDPGSNRVLCGPNPFGNVDSTVMAGRIVAKSSGKTLATIVNYACHPVSLGGGNKTVSPDYVGAMREVVETNTGGAPCVFLHGPSGNQTPRDSYASDPSVADNNGEILGFAALSVIRALLPAGTRFEFAGFQSSGAPLALWETRPFEVDRTLRSAVEYVHLPKKNCPTVEEIDVEIGRATDRAAWTRLTRLRRFVINLEEGLPNGFPIWGIRLGQSVVIGTPAEPFAELQVQLRNRFPSIAVIVANDTNGSYNYLPPASYYGNGAYEQDCSDFGPGCLEMVTQTAKNLIEQLMDISEARQMPAETSYNRQDRYTWT